MDGENLKPIITNLTGVSKTLPEGSDEKRMMDESIRQLSGISTDSKSGGDKTKGVIKTLSQIVSEMYNASKVQTYAPDNRDYLSTTLDNMETSSFKNFGAVVGGIIETAYDGMVDYIKEQSYLLGIVNKELGLSGQLSKDFRDRVTEAQPELVRMGIPFKDLTGSLEKLINDTGRFALVGTDMLVRAGEVATAYGMNMQDVISSYAAFEKVGIGASDAQEAIADAGARSLELGIQSRKVIEGMVENIGKLNQYGFQNGAEGLEKMVRRSLEVRMNLQDVFKVADQVFDPESALDLSANLQVLGASFGAFNDPLRLMYMATNEVEGLGGALEGVYQGLATYNESMGAFEVTGLQLRQAREIAKTLGVDLESVVNTAKALQERGQVDMALSGLQITDEDREFLANISRMENGQMSVELLTPKLQEDFGTTKIALKDLSQEGINQLLEYRNEFKKMSESDLVRQQVTLVENVSRDVNYLATLARLRAAGAGDAALKMVTDLDFKDQGSRLSELLKMDVDEIAKKFGDETSAQINAIQNKLGYDKIIQQQKEERERLTKEQSKPKEVVVTQTIKHVADQMMQGIQKEYVLNNEKFRVQSMGYLVPDK